MLFKVIIIIAIIVNTFYNTVSDLNAEVTSIENNDDRPVLFCVTREAYYRLPTFFFFFFHRQLDCQLFKCIRCHDRTVHVLFCRFVSATDSEIDVHKKKKKLPTLL